VGVGVLSRPSPARSRGGRPAGQEIGASGLSIWPLIAGIAVAMTVPLAILVSRSLRAGAVAGSFGFDGFGANFLYLVSQPVYQEVMLRTLWQSVAATVICVAVAYGCALALRSFDRGRDVWALLLLVAFVTGPLINVIGWMGLFVAGMPGYEVVNGIRAITGAEQGRVLDTEIAEFVGIVHFVLPFALLTMAPVMARVPTSLEQASRTLGASRWHTFTRIVWPFTRGSVASAAALSLALAASSYVAPQYLGGSRNMVMTTLVSQLMGSFAPELAASAGVILLLASLPLLILYVVFGSRGGVAARETTSRREAPYVRFPKTVSGVLLGATVLFLDAPLLVAAFQSVNDTTAFPAPFQGFTLEWYGRLFAYQPFVEGFRNSLVLAVSSTAIALALSGLAAFAIVRGPAWARRPWILAITTGPTIVPQIVIGLALLQFANAIALGLGWWTLIVAHGLLIAPFMLRILQPSVATVDARFEQAAATLGSARWRTAAAVVLPQLRSALFAAAMVGFTLSFINLPISLFLGTPATRTLPLAISEYMSTRLDPLVACYATVQAIACIVLLAIAQRYARLRLLS